MTPLRINDQTYDLLSQEFRAPVHTNGNGKVHSVQTAVVGPVAPQLATEQAVRVILESIGEDPDRQGLQRTPQRVAKAFAEFTAGYHVDVDALVNDAIFDVTYDEMVLVKDIDFFSLCEHHLLPFHGKAHVAYIPNGKVIGLSKIPRIVEMFARRLQVQERMTQEIADFLNATLNPQGVAVVVEGQHMCAAMRGVKKANARMTTSAMLGSFKHNPQTRAEFLDHVGRHLHR
jgi:GTP cyclohydrolase I